MKFSNNDLQVIFSLAKQYYLDEDKGNLDNQQFMAKCYIKAVSGYLKVDVDFETRIFVETVED